MRSYGESLLKTLCLDFTAVASTITMVLSSTLRVDVLARNIPFRSLRRLLLDTSYLFPRIAQVVSKPPFRALYPAHPHQL
jgi:hypothetical protein